MTASKPPIALHINRAFDEHLSKTLRQGSKLKGIAEHALAETCAALRDFDLVRAKKVIDSDQAANRLAHELVTTSAKTISLHQPVARDMRMLVGWILMSVEYERLADHAKNICKRICGLDNFSEHPLFHEDLNQLGELAVRQLADYAAAAQSGEVAKLLDVWKRDNEVDDAYRQITQKAYAGDAEHAQHALVQTLFMAKNYERIGDKVCNLAEISHYVVTGELPDHSDGS